MNTTRKCPQCGSDAYVGNEYYFRCGNKGEGDFTTAVCLESRCEQLSKRVILLEEAVDTVLLMKSNFDSSNLEGNEKFRSAYMAFVNGNSLEWQSIKDARGPKLNHWQDLSLKVFKGYHESSMKDNSGKP